MSTVVDLRSDVVSGPTAATRRVIADAVVGDLVFEDDPTVLRLEALVAQMLDKEAALLVPSGTMGNLVSVLSHCWGRGQEAIIGDKSHIFIWEQGNLSQFGGVMMSQVTNLDDGTFSLEELASKIRPEDDHEPTTSLVCIENTQCATGGKALPLEWIREVSSFCRTRGIPLHCDGARLFNAAAALGVPPKDLVSGCDSVTICLSKGLGAPMGSVVAGAKDFIKRAKRVRKALGGGLRQAGFIAAAGIHVLENHVQRLADDHRRAKELAQVFLEHGGSAFQTELSALSTNLVFVKIDPKVITAEDFVERLSQVPEEERDALGGSSVQIRCASFLAFYVRLVTHLDITDEMMEATKRKVQFVIKEILERKK